MLFSADCLGSGPRAARIVDRAYQYEGARIQVRAMSKIIAFKAKNVQEAEDYLSDFNMCKTHMGTGGDKLTPTLGIELLKQALANVEQLKVAVAAFAASGPTDLDARIDSSIED